MAARFPFAVALPFALMLCGCGSKPDSEDDDGRSASGQILEGTITDDMLPLDDLRSQPPLIKPSSSSATSGAPAATASAEADGQGVESGAEDSAPSTPSPVPSAD